MCTSRDRLVRLPASNGAGSDRMIEMQFARLLGAVASARHWRSSCSAAEHRAARAAKHLIHCCRSCRTRTSPTKRDLVTALAHEGSPAARDGLCGLLDGDSTPEAPTSWFRVARTATRYHRRCDDGQAWRQAPDSTSHVGTNNQLRKALRGAHRAAAACPVRTPQCACRPSGADCAPSMRKATAAAARAPAQGERRQCTQGVRRCAWPSPICQSRCRGNATRRHRKPAGQPQHGDLQPPDRDGGLPAKMATQRAGCRRARRGHRPSCCTSSTGAASIPCIETLFFGLSLGSVLVLAGIGLAMTFGVMGVINMAHGELMMLGAYTRLRGAAADAESHRQRRSWCRFRLPSWLPGWSAC